MTADLNLKLTDLCPDKNAHDMLICLQLRSCDRGVFDFFHERNWDRLRAAFSLGARLARGKITIGAGLQAYKGHGGHGEHGNPRTTVSCLKETCVLSHLGMHLS